MALRKFSNTLLMFSALECIMINNLELGLAPASLNALADCLKLPTVKEIHVTSVDTFPLSWFDSCKNTQNLSLLGSFKAEAPLSDLAMPRLKSLALDIRSFAGLKPHINKLQSLRCGSKSVEMLPELLGLCSGTLTKLEVNLDSSLYFCDYAFATRTIDICPFPDLPSIPHDLQQLTIHTTVDLHQDVDGVPLFYSSYLPAASGIISLFISSGPPRHLALDIHLNLKNIANLPLINFSPLAVLKAASLSIPHIDLYVRALPPVLTRAQFLSSLEKHCEGVVQSIEDGGLVIHMEKTAPDCIAGDWILPLTY